jgi:2-polyprenyl-3-methyl-5-hydroxy-6-metoxy-1,4-benzoquinol methylase
VTAYFDGLARNYAQHRPDYPDEAIDFILAGLPPRVRTADVGCGTGISSRLLARRSASVIGIDPNSDMLDQARADASADPAATIEYRRGTEASTPASMMHRSDWSSARSRFTGSTPPRRCASFIAS